MIKRCILCASFKETIVTLLYLLQIWLNLSLHVLHLCYKYSHKGAPHIHLSTRVMLNTHLVTHLHVYSHGRWTGIVNSVISACEPDLIASVFGDRCIHHSRICGVI